MPAFRWEAVDVRGQVRHGLLEADTPRAARDRLRADGLTPTAVENAPQRGTPLVHTRLPAASVALFTRQIATLAIAGMPLDQSLQAMIEQADDPRVAAITTALRGHLAAGEPLPVALARFPRTFSPLYRGLVGV